MGIMGLFQDSNLDYNFVTIVFFLYPLWRIGFVRFLRIIGRKEEEKLKLFLLLLLQGQWQRHRGHGCKNSMKHQNLVMKLMVWLTGRILCLHQDQKHKGIFLQLGERSLFWEPNLIFCNPFWQHFLASSQCKCFSVLVNCCSASCFNKFILPINHTICVSNKLPNGSLIWLWNPISCLWLSFLANVMAGTVLRS